MVYAIHNNVYEFFVEHVCIRYTLANVQSA